jgi:hypothetical protein
MGRHVLLAGEWCWQSLTDGGLVRRGKPTQPSLASRPRSALLDRGLRCSNPKPLIDEILRLTRFWGARGSGDRAETVEKEAETDAELEETILQRLVIGGVFVSVQPDASLGWRPTVNRTS